MQPYAHHKLSVLQANSTLLLRNNVTTTTTPPPNLNCTAKCNTVACEKDVWLKNKAGTGFSVTGLTCRFLQINLWSLKSKNLQVFHLTGFCYFFYEQRFLSDNFFSCAVVFSHCFFLLSNILVTFIFNTNCNKFTTRGD
jgi:hypothetical protein